ncbi:TPA: recombinase family protein [Burkholderia vietnamiensis]|nr:recombinase family protein [Burkholderia vietnamiensis]
MARVFAYARVSTSEQTIENQRLEISQAGFDVQPHRFISETISGATPAAERPGFAKLLDKLEADDLLVVSKLDRLGRNSADVVTTVERLAASGVRVHCLALGGADLTSATGKLTMGVLAAVAQFERDLLIDRTNAGLARAKAQGKRLGRPVALTADQHTDVLKRLAVGESERSIGVALGVSRTTIARARKAATGAAQTT